MASIISIKSLEKRRELIELLDQAIALGVELNQQLSSIGLILASTEVEQKLAA